MDAKELLGNDFDTFEEQDPFNPENVVAGVISRKSNQYYGALIIQAVNGEPVTEQLIMGTPKMEYPFSTLGDGTRKFGFPEATSIEVYEKLDGTNILAFGYCVGAKTFVTFKTRLRPFVRDGRFGAFRTMLLELLPPYRDLVDDIVRGGWNLSFEMYGRRNIHLIVYDTDLDLALLFAVNNLGRILSPIEIARQIPVACAMLIVVPWVVLRGEYPGAYDAMRQDMNSTLSEVEEGRYRGQEGSVWYLNTVDRRCIQFKCKPELVEAIHFAQGAGGLSWNVVLATCWNAFENVDVPTFEFVCQLLAEEFEPRAIELNHALIQKCVDFANTEMAFRQEVLAAYRETGLNIRLHKREVMQQLSWQFERGKMGKVYAIIDGYG